MLVVADFEALKRHLGTEVAVTDYLEIDQPRIAAFADITQDSQWIHTDVERSRRESPFGETVAHGFLILSLVSRFLEEAARIDGTRLIVSCGLGTVRFQSPVPAGSRIRARVRLRECSESPDYLQATWRFTIEREGDRLPACVADWTVRYCR